MTEAEKLEIEKLEQDIIRLLPDQGLQLRKLLAVFSEGREPSTDQQEESPKRNVLPIVINEAKLVLVTEDCAICGVVFAMPRKLQVGLKANRRTFYCPNGHMLWYPNG